MAGTVLPPVGGASSPARREASPASPYSPSSSCKLPPLASSPPESEFGEDGLAAEQAVFASTFGSLAGEKTPSKNSQDQLETILQNFKFFQDLDPGIQAAIPSMLSTMSKRSGTVLFRQGDTPGNCYIVLNGEAGIFVKSEEELAEDNATPAVSGTKTVEGYSTYGQDTNFGIQIGSLGPGTLVGELALLNEQPRSASIQCLKDTDFLVLRRSDFDLILRDEMVRKGDEKFRFLMGHVPGMRDVVVPKTGTKQPHASYFFQKASFPRGHCFFQEGSIAETSVIVVFKGTAECRRSEHAPPGIGAALPPAALAPAPLADYIPGGAKLGNFRRSPSMVSKSNYQARLLSLARERPHCDTVNRLGVFSTGSVFGSLPFEEKEPFTVVVTSAQCEVFICTGPDLVKVPRPLVLHLREFLANAASWRLKSHLHCQDFRKSRPPEVLEKMMNNPLATGRPLARVRSSPMV